MLQLSEKWSIREYIITCLLFFLLYVFGGLLGWALKGVEEIFGFLTKGCGTLIMWIIGILELIAIITG